MARVLIIGAGPGGLAASLLLAKAGVDVTILEKQPFVGGRTSTQVAGEFKFDLGPTFFLYPRVLESIFQAAGTMWICVGLTRSIIWFLVMAGAFALPLS